MTKKDHSRETALLLAGCKYSPHPTGTFRAFLLAAFLLLVTVPARAQLTVVQAQNASSAGGGNTLPVTISTSANNLLVLMEAQGSAATDNATPTDSAGNTWQLAVSFASGSLEISMYYAKNAAAVTSVTATFTGSPTNIVAIVYEISGADTSSPLDGTGVGSTGTGVSGSSDETSGTLSTTNANTILIYAVRMGNASVTTWTAGSNYTIPTNGSFLVVRSSAMQYQIVSSTQTNVTASITQSGSTSSFTTAFAAFVAASGAAASPGINKRQKYEQMDP